MKTVCMRHEQAYEVGTCCPWCEPEPPGRAYSFPARPVVGARWAAGTFVSGKVEQPRLTLADMEAYLKKLWHDPVREKMEKYYRDAVDLLWRLETPRLLADPECPPNMAYAFNPADESYTYKLTVPVVTVHPSYLCKVKLP